MSRILAASPSVLALCFGCVAVKPRITTCNLDLTTRVIKKSRPLTVTPSKSTSSPVWSSSLRVWMKVDSL
jgi:hypothetical protein